MAVKLDILGSVHELCVLERDKLEVVNTECYDAYVNLREFNVTGYPIDLKFVRFYTGDNKVTQIREHLRTAKFYNRLQVQSADIAVDDMTLRINRDHDDRYYEDPFCAYIVALLQGAVQTDRINRGRQAPINYSLNRPVPGFKYLVKIASNIY